MTGSAFPDQGLPQAAAAWALDPAVTMLNHGSFGACPRVVLERQCELRRRMEARPVQFFARHMPELLDAARRRLAGVVGADPQDLVFVSNATAGVNSVLRSLSFRDGDEILATTHGYNACNNVARCVAQQGPAMLVLAEIPSPVESPQHIVRRGAVAGQSADADCPLGPCQQSVGRGLSHRGPDPAAARAGDRDLDRRGPRARHGAARLAAARRHVLHRQLPQVALCALGDRVSVRPARTPGSNPAARRQPRLQPAAARSWPLSGPLRLAGHHRPHGLVLPGRGD